MHKVLSLALSIVLMVTSCLGTFCYAAPSVPSINEMKIQLGGDDGTWYNTMIDHTNKKIILALPAQLIGIKAMQKAKIAYKVTGTLSADTDSIYQSLSDGVVFTASNEGITQDYTMEIFPLTMQRDYNFNGATLIEKGTSAWGTKERRKALGFLSGTGGGLWHNFGYSFNDDGTVLEDETFGVMELKTETSPDKSYLINKTKTGGVLGVTSIEGNAEKHFEQTDAYTLELDFNVQEVFQTGSDNILFTIRTSDIEKIVIVKSENTLKAGYISSDGTITLNNSETFGMGEFHTLKTTFRKYNTDGYALDIKVDDKYIDTVYNSGSVGKLNTPVVDGAFDYSAVGLEFFAHSDAKLKVKIDNYKLYANNGDKAFGDDTSMEYIYGDDAPLSEGNLNAPLTPPQPGVQKPDSPYFDGTLDLGFEHGAAGWNLSRVNLIPNSSFEEEAMWSVGRNDHNRTVNYTTEKAYSGSKSVKVEYTDSDREKYQAGVRNNITAEINPMSEYMLGMAVIFNPVHSQSPDDADDKVNNSNIKTALDFKRPTPDGNTTEDTSHVKVSAQISDWQYIEDYFLSTEPCETYVKDFMPRIDCGGVGTLAYFDDVYFGTLCHVINENNDKYSGMAYSGDNLLHLGAYNGIHSEDGMDKAETITLPVTEHRTYTMKAYAMKKSNSAVAKIAIAFYDAEDNLLDIKKGSPVTTDDWTETSVSASAPKGASGMKLYLLAEGSGSVSFDHVSYEEEPQILTSFIGADDTNIVLGETEEKTIVLDIYAADQFGQPVINLNEDFELVSPLSTGVVLTENNLTVSSSVPNGTAIKIKVTAGDLEPVNYILAVVRGSLEIIGTSSVTRGNTDTNYVYKAYFNSNGISTLLSDTDATWSVTGVGSNIALSDGTLIVKSNTEIGNYRLKAVLNQNKNIFAEYTVSVSKQAEPVVTDPDPTPSTSLSGPSYGGGMPSVPQIPPQINETPVFNDVPADFWGYEAINYFAQKGYISGDGSGDFKTYDSISRAEYIKVLLMVFGIEVKEHSTSFTDVSKDAWYYGYVTTANALGLVNGVNDENFAPDASITRQDMAVIIQRVLNFMNINLSGNDEKNFTDEGDISPYAFEAIKLLSSNSVINGMGDNSVKPLNTATRAECIQMLFNLIGKIKEAEVK